MSESKTILRVAAKGDGVAADGAHFKGTAPGDTVASDGSIARGPHHVTPPCRHFGVCGGCQLQHCDEETLRDFVTSRVTNAALKEQLDVDELLPAHLSPPRSRRRATLHIANAGGRPQVGFREAGSHKIVDMQECEILRPELFALVGSLRQMMARRSGRYAVDAELSLTDQGVDCALKNLPVEGLAQTEALLDFAKDNELARLTLDQGYGPEAVWEPEPVTVSFSGIPVSFPSGSFLQATADGERALVADTRAWLDGSKLVADLFSGLGTFAFALAGTAKVLAAEAARDAHFACKSAASFANRPVHSMHRDLFRNPLQLDELNRFDAVVLDPPRAGAKDQIALLAHSDVARIVYISCNPSSWARDAAQLVKEGYRLEKLHPVGQFRWSTHVELASLFVKAG
ncbi:class I SAM-dependent RNA methyltransferase [Altererythrobacter confluentis]|uniref:Class I SAM-dependent RNA methyltransferase n=1 Tax=Allopontixanthobacter confluentis TaxID=1849021 RepID=A0A6L7GFM8_9SPHN|nr:class I SAM-dependent RNA methyltransferase [Allopontixanthobacter confluentis]